VVSKILEINRVGLVRTVNSSNREVSKEICLLCLVVETKWDNKANLVKEISLVVMVVNKVKVMELVNRVRDLVVKANLVLEINLGMVKVSQIILMVIMTERKLLRML
jgi:hypothetical protein